MPYSFVLLFFLSPDSYLYDLYYHGDSAVFFMCGKAWMNGMVPYADFADSKGPLLWLIYGIGYLISHHSYIGMFWISVLFYTITLFAAYKLCRLFVDRDVAAMSTAALPFFLFLFFIHAEVRAEDFCYPFVMVPLYCVCRILRYRDSDARTYFKLSALMGVCSMCCVLIKYNIGCMIMGLMSVALYMAIRHKAGWQSFAGMAIGFVAPAIPFIICFLIYGNMGAFIQEYFLNTFETIENKSTTNNIRTNLIVSVGILMLLLSCGIVCFSRKHKLGYWLIPCFLLFIIGLGKASNGYYYTITLPFFIFLCVTIVEVVLNRLNHLRKGLAVECVIIAILSIGFNLSFVHRFTFDKDARTNYYKAAYVMSQIKNPRVMWYSIDYGTGIPAGCLPGCRYWTLQAGATKDMIRERENDIIKGVPDFICTFPSEEKVKKIEQGGYVFYCKSPVYYSKSPSNVSVYGRPGLRLPPEDFHVSQWDVWLKRNIFGI